MSIPAITAKPSEICARPTQMPNNTKKVDSVALAHLLQTEARPFDSTNVFYKNFCAGLIVFSTGTAMVATGFGASPETALLISAVTTTCAVVSSLITGTLIAYT